MKMKDQDLTSPYFSKGGFAIGDGWQGHAPLLCADDGRDMAEEANSELSDWI